MEQRRFLRWAWLAAVLLAVPACTNGNASDAEKEASSLYDLSFEATPSVEAGGPGKVTVRILPRGDAKVLEEAPLSLALEAPAQVKLDKTRLGRGEYSMDGSKLTFEVGFTGASPGEGVIKADLSFFICTDKLCVRQNRAGTLPVAVR